ncbi:MAG: hypothetical protein B7Z58_13675 [Acidiphilium sp. 37-64-53]|nr:MAG: hypothetical protein B7Z58_13675 [Acidiphilium sp. 37-64-53]
MQRIRHLDTLALPNLIDRRHDIERARGGHAQIGHRGQAGGEWKLRHCRAYVGVLMRFMSDRHSVHRYHRGDGDRPGDQARAHQKL